MTTEHLYRIRGRLRLKNDAKFVAINPAPGRANAIIVDGATVEVKVATKGPANKWRVNIHRHGKLDESGVDAYLICLEGVPDTSGWLYLLFAAPVGRTCFSFTVRSLMSRYSAFINDWETLRRIVKGLKKSARVA